MAEPFVRKKDGKAYSNYEEIKKIIGKEIREISLKSDQESNKAARNQYLWMAAIDILLLIIFIDSDIVAVTIIFAIAPFQFIFGPLIIESIIGEPEMVVKYKKEWDALDLELLAAKQHFKEPIDQYESYKTSNSIETKIFQEIAKKQNRTNTIPSQGKAIKSFQNMSGLDFENYIYHLLIHLGYKDVKITSLIGTNATYKGDGGVDLTAIDDFGKKVAIQCKNHKLVSNDIISRTHGAKDLSKYKCDYAMVITSGKFTVPATIEARDLGVVLWDGEELEKMIKKAQLAKTESYVLY